MILNITRRGKSKQPWRWQLWYDNREPASHGGEPFPNERRVAQAVYRYLYEHASETELTFRGEAIPGWMWNDWEEALFVKHLVKLIRTLPPERLGVGGKGKGAK